MLYLIESKRKTDIITDNPIIVGKITAIKGFDGEDDSDNEIIIEPDTNGFMCMSKISHGFVNSDCIYGKSFHVTREIKFDDIIEVRIGQTWIPYDKFSILGVWKDGDDDTEVLDMCIEILDRSLLRKEVIRELL